jgi:hypothetical protein
MAPQWRGRHEALGDQTKADQIGERLSGHRRGVPSGWRSWISPQEGGANVELTEYIQAIWAMPALSRYFNQE